MPFGQSLTYNYSIKITVILLAIAKKKIYSSEIEVRYPFANWIVALRGEEQYTMGKDGAINLLMFPHVSDLFN